MKGYIHSFESLASVDGAGLRCAVFLSGCPLRCAFCHNPDTWNEGGDLVEADALVRKIERFKPYFGQDGGVTFSGGEPLLQAGFIREAVGLLAERKINYAIDTSGCVDLTEDVKWVLRNAQLVLLDIKFWGDSSYLKYTGRGIEKTLDVLRFLETEGVEVWVRTVVVPEINDNEEMLEKYLKIVEGLSCVKKYELLGFHTLGFYKYEQLNIKNPLANTPPLSAEVRDRLQRFVNEKLNK